MILYNNICVYLYVHARFEYIHIGFVCAQCNQIVLVCIEGSMQFQGELSRPTLTTHVSI